MAERMDPAAVARRILDEGADVVGKLREARERGEMANADDYGKKAAGCWAQAQAFATLALVEQQRVTNLLELNRQLTENDQAFAGKGNGPQYREQRMAIRREVLDVLGVSRPVEKR